MAGIQEPHGPRVDQSLVRDAALLRINRTRRWAWVGAAALSAGLAALASALLPGKSFGAKARATIATPSTQAASTPSQVAPPLPAPESGAQLGLGASNQSQPAPVPQPQAAPQPAPEPAPAPQAAPAPQPVPAGGGGAVVSGGS